jgi:hypothetical protein
MASVERLVIGRSMILVSIPSHHYTSDYFSVGWPDTVKGLLALKHQVIIATLSNGNVRLLVDMVISNFYSHSSLKATNFLML